MIVGITVGCGANARRYGPAQALTALEALAGFTTGAAAAAGDERAAGRIRAGLRADLTAFAGDPLTTEPDDLPALPVAFTLVGGRLVG
jgi:predicted amidohydrolase YtcJ